MTGSASALESEYDAFLYASVYPDDHEAMLSVVSLLTGLGVDPWHEAARLARLPTASATTRLALLISQIPGGCPRHLDARATASRLVKLLPPDAPKTPSLLKLPLIGRVNHPRTILLILFILAVLGVQYWAADRSGDPAPVDGSSSTRQ